jgi:hypothetical protein
MLALGFGFQVHLFCRPFIDKNENKPLPGQEAIEPTVEKARQMHC